MASESEDEAEHIALPAMAEALAEPRGEGVGRAEQARRRRLPTAAPAPATSANGLGHIPHGFYEAEMTGFFAQSARCAAQEPREL